MLVRKVKQNIRAKSNEIAKQIETLIKKNNDERASLTDKITVFRNFLREINAEKSKRHNEMLIINSIQIFDTLATELSVILDKGCRQANFDIKPVSDFIEIFNLLKANFLLVNPVDQKAYPINSLSFGPYIYAMYSGFLDYKLARIDINEFGNDDYDFTPLVKEVEPYLEQQKQLMSEYTSKHPASLIRDIYQKFSFWYLTNKSYLLALQKNHDELARDYLMEAESFYHQVSEQDRQLSYINKVYGKLLENTMANADKELAKPEINLLKAKIFLQDAKLYTNILLEHYRVRAELIRNRDAAEAEGFDKNNLDMLSKTLETGIEEGTKTLRECHLKMHEVNIKLLQAQQIKTIIPVKILQDKTKFLVHLIFPDDIDMDLIDKCARRAKLNYKIDGRKLELDSFYQVNINHLVKALHEYKNFQGPELATIKPVNLIEEKQKSQESVIKTASSQIEKQKRSNKAGTLFFNPHAATSSSNIIKNNASSSINNNNNNSKKSKNKKKKTKGKAKQASVVVQSNDLAPVQFSNGLTTRSHEVSELHRKDEEISESALAAKPLRRFICVSDNIFANLTENQVQGIKPELTSICNRGLQLGDSEGARGIIVLSQQQRKMSGKNYDIKIKNASKGIRFFGSLVSDVRDDQDKRYMLYEVNAVKLKHA